MKEMREGACGHLRGGRRRLREQHVQRPCGGLYRRSEADVAGAE